MSDDTRIGFLDVLFLVIQGSFIAMKLMGKLDWSWWLVLSPTWGLFGIVLVLGLFIGGGVGVAQSGGHIMAFFRRRSRLKTMYAEDPEVKPRPAPTAPEHRWWE